MELVNQLFTANYAVILVVGFLGMFAHFLKKNIKGESGTEIKAYFKDNRKDTYLAIIATLVGTAAYHLALGTGGTTDLINAFAIGFTFDSMLNKWEAAGAKIKE